MRDELNLRFDGLWIVSGTRRKLHIHRFDFFFHLVVTDLSLILHHVEIIGFIQ